MKSIDSVSELVEKRLMNFENLRPEKLKVESDKEAEKRGYFRRDFGMNHWDWPQGIALYALNEGGNSEYIKEWAKKQISSHLPLININTVCPMLTLMDYPEYESLSLEWMEWIEKNFPRTKEAGFQHDTTGKSKYEIKVNKEQLWADSLFMTVLFVAKMGVKYKNNTWINEAIYQVLVHIKYLSSNKSGLFNHGWDFENQSDFGAVHWCRGNSWMTMSLPLILDLLKEYLSEGEKKIITFAYQSQVASLMKLRDEGGLWHTVLDDETSYLEVSGSAGIIAGILIGMRFGLVKVEKDWIIKSLEALIDCVDCEGVVLNVSAGTAISCDSEDYKRIIKSPMVYGQALVMVALNEYKKQYKGENFNEME